jgi:transcription antitermination factor NusG
VADAGLRDRGYHPFTPTYVERRKYSDRIKSVATAVFPGYLFCRFDLSRKSSVLNAPAVEYIVSVGDEAGVIQHSDISNIQRVLDAGGYRVPYLNVGQRVKVESGPLRGIEGILTRKHSIGELTISMELLQRSISVRIDATAVRAI